MQNSNLQQIISEMDLALADEIDSQQTKKTAKRIAVDGKPLSEQSNQYLYTFSLEEPWEPQDETPLTIRILGDTLKATLVNSRGLTITIVTEKQLPVNTLHRVELFDDSTRLLENLRKAITNTDEGSSQLGSKSFGLLQFIKSRRGSTVAFGGFEPEKSQEQAIQMALGSQVTFIIGPPGTGKTSTLAAIAFAHLCSENTVLIAAHTNIAVDTAIMQLSKLCQQTGKTTELQEGRIVRYGTPQHRSLLEDSKFENVYLPKIARRRGSQLHQQRDGLELSRTQVVERIEKYTQEQTLSEVPWQMEHQKITEQCANARTDMAQVSTQLRLVYAQEHELSPRLQQAQQYVVGMKKAIGDITAREDALLQSHPHLEAQIRTLAAQVNEAKEMSPFKRFIKRINENRLLEQLGDADQQSRATQQELIQLPGHKEKLYREYEPAVEACEALRGALNNAVTQGLAFEARAERLRTTVQLCEQGIAELDARLHLHRQKSASERYQLESEKTDLENKLTNIDGQIAGLEKYIVENALVVATTLSKIYMAQVLQQRRFDVVIVDEVSMAPLPSVYVAASHANMSVVAIGDPHQLSPIVNAENSPAAQKWLGKDLFWWNKISLGSLAQDSQNCTLLNEQSRMHPVISKIIREHVYEGRVKDAERLNKRGATYENIPPSPGKPLELCDTSDGAPIVTKPANGSRINMYHALCTMALVQKILSTELPAPEQNGHEHRIGVVTPYAPQARLLQRLIRGTGLESLVRAGTVHRFQGLEFDVVIFDTVESPPLLPVRDFTAGGFQSDAMRLINVAITRARHKLVIIANTAYLRSHLQYDDTLSQVIKHAQAACTIRSQDLLRLPFPTPDEIVQNVIRGVAPDRLLHELPKVISDIGFFNKQSFFASFKRDLQSSLKTIVIFSPYVSSKRLREILPLLSERSQAGVDVRVFTRPPEQVTNPTAPDAMASLRSTLGKIQERDKMHEKLVIIDGEIVYLGSLNVLSHIDTLEIMIRVQSQNFADAVEHCVNMGSSFKNLSKQEEIIESSGTPIKLFLKDLPSAFAPCNVCGSDMLVRPGNTGMPFYGCRNYERHLETKYYERMTERHLACITSLENIRCEDCGGTTYIKIPPRQNGLVICSKCGHSQEIIFSKN